MSKMITPTVWGKLRETVWFWWGAKWHKPEHDHIPVYRGAINFSKLDIFTRCDAPFISEIKPSVNYIIFPEDSTTHRKWILIRVGIPSHLYSCLFDAPHRLVNEIFSIPVLFLWLFLVRPGFPGFSNCRIYVIESESFFSNSAKERFSSAQKNASKKSEAICPVCIWFNTLGSNVGHSPHPIFSENATGKESHTVNTKQY